MGSFSSMVFNHLQRFIKKLPTITYSIFSYVLKLLEEFAEVKLVVM